MRDSFFLPLLGGGRSQNIEILSVTPPDGFGTADIIGDLFRFKAGPVLEEQPFGIPIPFPVSVRYLDGDGKTVDTVVFITSTNGPTGARLTLPGGQIAEDTALISPIPVDAQFNDPFSFATPPLTQPIIIDESVFVDVFNARNPEFLEAFVTTQAAFVEASVARTVAIEATLQAAEALEFLSNAAEARATATAQRTIADTQANLLASVQAELTEALAAFNAALIGLTSAQSALDEANQQVQITASLLDVQQVLLANAVLDFIEADVTLLTTLVQLGLQPPAEQHFDLPGVGPIIESLAALRDQRQEAVDNITEEVEVLETQLNNAITAQSEAVTAFAQAASALAAAEERLDDLADVDFEALEESVAALEVVASAQELVAAQLEAVAADQFGVDVPISQSTLEAFGFALSEAIQSQALADVAAGQTQAAFEAAAQAYQDQLDALPDFEFTFAAFQAGFGLEANLGLEFHFNQATEDTPREFVTTLLYDVGLEVDLNSVLVVPDVFLGIDVETPIEIDFEFERSGRVQLGGRDRPERPERGERFERFETGESLAEFGSGERLGNWADSFDFL